MALQLLRAIWLAPSGRVERLFLTGEFLLFFCVLNLPVGAGIRGDLTVNLREAWVERRWRRLAGLIALGGLIYPLHNRVTRALYRLLRKARLQ
jgi:hypothetical protein